MLQRSRIPASETTYHPAADAARLAGVTPARLRRYERAGLLRPVQRHGRIRLYSAAQVAQVRRIRRLHEDLGINLAGVEIILRLLAQIEALQTEQRRRSSNTPATLL